MSPEYFFVLQVTVWDYDRFGANEFLGKYFLNNYYTEHI
jgi:hypothetical protein